ncbi:MAG: hypothetical protein KJ666_11805 [Bacteroidetes bacterium]|nr:hypothetical protein [Bacteroidota bacterium]MBU2586117.1 hypothetical protein [Bacteroidota bacterium]
MKRNEIVAALEPVIKSLNDLDILYYIGGSVASSAFGIARATLDVDLILQMGSYHITPLITKLKNEYYIDEEMINDAIRTESSFNLIHLETMLKIDVFISKNQPYPQKALERKIQDKLEDDPNTIDIYLCSPEDVILSKLEWYKSGGEKSERQWLDVLGVIKVQGDILDKSYLKMWAKELSVFNLLEKSFEECGVVL